MKLYEIGLLKDILWYLRGARETGGISEIKDYHITTLAQGIETLQKGGEKDVSKN